MTEPDILYYDGDCALCQREMAHLARLKSDQLVLQNIHDLEPAADIPSRESLLKSLHLRRGGAWTVGSGRQYRRLATYTDWRLLALAVMAHCKTGGQLALSAVGTAALCKKISD